MQYRLRYYCERGRPAREVEIWKCIKARILNAVELETTVLLRERQPSAWSRSIEIWKCIKIHLAPEFNPQTLGHGLHGCGYKEHTMHTFSCGEFMTASHMVGARRQKDSVFAAAHAAGMQMYNHVFRTVRFGEGKSTDFVFSMCRYAYMVLYGGFFTWRAWRT